MPSDFPALEEARDELTKMRNETQSILDSAGGLKSLNWDKLDGRYGANREEKRGWFLEQQAKLSDKFKEVKGLADMKASLEANLDFEDGSNDNDPERGTLGHAFIKSDSYRKRVKNGAGAESTVKVGLKTLFERGNGWEPEVTRQGGVLLSAQRPAPKVVNYIAQGSIDQMGYKYMEETTFTNAAAETAEAATYKEVALKLSEKQQNVEKITAWLPMTDEQLQDEREAMAYINDRLGLMLAQRLDLQVLAGNGTTPNLLGTENVVGIQNEATTGDLIADIANMVSDIEEAHLTTPSVIFMRPSTWVTNFQLATSTDGNYIWGHPSSVAAKNVWGLPVVTSMAVTSGKVIMGDYATSARLLIRRGVDMQVSNSHSDFFINGKQAVRADLRAVMVHFRPGAFGQITGL